MSKQYKWIVEFEVDASWIADGFNMTDESAHEMLATWLPYAYGHELKARVVRAPDANSIAKEQGYRDAKHAGLTV